MKYWERRNIREHHDRFSKIREWNRMREIARQKREEEKKEQRQ